MSELGEQTGSEQRRAAQRLLLIAALLAGSAVILGAFAAHLLRGELSPRALHSFETGARYQLTHALALLWIGGRLERAPSGALSWAGRLIAGGIFLFSGSLYGLSLGGPRWLGPVTPLGGLALISGWLLLAISLWRGLSARAESTRP